MSKDLGNPTPVSHRRDRYLSTASFQAVSTLESLEASLEDLESKTLIAEKFIINGEALPEEYEGIDLRNALAQAFGSTSVLLGSGIDSVLTGDLNSGKDEARAKRKDLTKRAQALCDKCEELIKAVDSKH